MTILLVLDEESWHRIYLEYQFVAKFLFPLICYVPYNCPKLSYNALWNSEKYSVNSCRERRSETCLTMQVTISWYTV